jgi:hypothetical protein
MMNVLVSGGRTRARVQMPAWRVSRVWEAVWTPEKLSTVRDIREVCLTVTVNMIPKNLSFTETQDIHTCTSDIFDQGEHSYTELKLKSQGDNGVKTGTHFTRTDFEGDEYIAYGPGV